MDSKKPEEEYEVIEDASYELVDDKGEVISAGAPTIAVDRAELEDKPAAAAKEAPPPLTPAPTLPDAARPVTKKDESRPPRAKITIEKGELPASRKAGPPKIEVELKGKEAERLRGKIKVSEPRPQQRG